MPAEHPGEGGAASQPGGPEPESAGPASSPSPSPSPDESASAPTPSGGLTDDEWFERLRAHRQAKAEGRPDAPVSADDDKGAVWREYKRVMTQVSFLGLELGFALAIGYFGGRWLDGQLGTTPWLTWFGLAIGMTAAVKDFVKVIKMGRRKGQSEPGRAAEAPTGDESGSKASGDRD
jgi:ATP synthase protein I